MPLPLIPIAVALAVGGTGIGASVAYFTSSTYEGKIYEKWKEKTGQSDKSLQDNYRLSPTNAMIMIGKLRWYVINQNANVDNKKSLSNTAKKIIADLKFPNKTYQEQAIYIAFLISVVDSISTSDEDLYRYLRGGQTDRDVTSARIDKVLDEVSQKTGSLSDIIGIEKYFKYGLIFMGGYIAIKYMLPALTNMNVKKRRRQ